MSKPPDEAPEPRVISMPGITVNDLRGLFRNLQAFRAYYASENEDTIRDSRGREWCLWDIEYLYAQRWALSPRQAEAIELCLFLNMTESSAAVAMGVSETNPVSMYATDGLKKLIAMIETGSLARYSEESVA